MMTFVFILKSKRRGELTSELLRAHVAHLKALHAQGALAICGPFANDDGAIQILRAHSKAGAIELFEKDPFIQEKYYSDYDVYELHEACDDNGWLMDLDQTQSNLKG